MEARILRLAEWARPFPRLAEIGAGPGRLTRLLLRQGHRVIATDISARATAMLIAITHPALTVRQGDGFGIVTPDEVDAAIVAGVGGHTIARMLDGSPRWRQWTVILQPMRHPGPVLDALRRHHQAVAAADLVLSRGRIYVIVITAPGQIWHDLDADPWDTLEEWLGQHPLWPAWVRQEHPADATRRGAPVVMTPPARKEAILHHVHA
jgi:tRNA A22 N-methylase